MLENGLNYTGSIPGYNLGIKSGTAQVKTVKKKIRCLPVLLDDESFPIAFAVLIENRQSSDISTGSIVYEILSNLD